MSKEAEPLKVGIEKCIANAKASINGHKGFVAASLIQVAVSKKGILDPKDNDIQTIKQTFIDSDPAKTNSDAERIRRGAEWVKKVKDGILVDELEGGMEESKSIIQVQNEINKQINALIKHGGKEEDFRAIKAELVSYTQEITNIFTDEEKLYNLVAEKTTRGLIYDSFPKFIERQEDKSLIEHTVSEVSNNIKLPQAVATRYILASKEEKDAIIAICRNVNNNIFGKELKPQGQNSYYVLDASKITPENKALAAQEIQSKLENYVLINQAIDNALEKKQEEEKKADKIKLTQARRDKIFESLNPVLQQLDPEYLKVNREQLIKDLAGRLDKKIRAKRFGNNEMTISEADRSKISKEFLAEHKKRSDSYVVETVALPQQTSIAQVLNNGRPLPALPRPLPPVPPKTLAYNVDHLKVTAEVATGAKKAPTASTIEGVRGPSYSTPPSSPASTTGGVRGPSDMNKTKQTVSKGDVKKGTHYRVVVSEKTSPASRRDKERTNQLEETRILSKKIVDSMQQEQTTGKQEPTTRKRYRVVHAKSTNPGPGL